MAREPLVYEGRIRMFDVEPSNEIYLLDHPASREFNELGLADLIEKWSEGEIQVVGPPSRRLRITIEEVAE